MVHGCDGLDEITLAGPTDAALWDGRSVSRLTMTPESVGIDRAEATVLAGGDAAFNADIIRAVLDGATGPCADIVRLNAGAALWVAEEASTLADGVARATELMRTGAPLEVVRKLAALSTELAA